MEDQTSIAEQEMASNYNIEATTLSNETITEAEKHILLFSNPVVDSILHKMD